MRVRTFVHHSFAAKIARSCALIPITDGNLGQWDTELEAQLVKQADTRGLLNLKGYRTVGGMRASLYNALPEEGVDELVAFLTEFEEKHQRP